MAIKTIWDYVDFFINLEMGNKVTLLSFVNNEKIILKNKLKNKEIKKEKILKAIKILDELNLEIKLNGEKQIFEKFFKNKVE